MKCTMRIKVSAIVAPLLSADGVVWLPCFAGDGLVRFRFRLGSELRLVCTAVVL